MQMRKGKAGRRYKGVGPGKSNPFDQDDRENGILAVTAARGLTQGDFTTNFYFAKLQQKYGFSQLAKIRSLKPALRKDFFPKNRIAYTVLTLKPSPEQFFKVTLKKL